jgi:hypothetical protein
MEKRMFKAPIKVETTFGVDPVDGKKPVLLKRVHHSGENAMKKWFVFYQDDYAENGGVGLAEFGTKAEAEAFIVERMSRSSEPNILAYKVISGFEHAIEKVQVVSKVKIGPANQM